MNEIKKMSIGRSQPVAKQSIYCAGRPARMLIKPVEAFFSAIFAAPKDAGAQYRRTFHGGTENARAIIAHARFLRTTGVVTFLILYASLAWSATSCAGMMGGGHHGSNGHHGGYGDYDGHHGGNGGYDGHHGDGAYHGGGYNDYHGGYADDPGPGWGRGRDTRARDEHFGDTGAGHGDEFDNAPAPADKGQPRQGP